MTPETLAGHIRHAAEARQGRFIAALAGPPGAGKSTLASALVAILGHGSRAIPMDGFHFDDRVLTARGLRDRKGAPETFDVQGFLHLLTRLRSEDEVAFPLFDRTLEISRAGADLVTAADHILIVEGNWLLLDEAPWNVAGYDLTVFIDVPEGELERRLLARWAHYGKSLAEARTWIDGNDMPNIRRCIHNSRPADMWIL